MKNGISTSELWTGLIGLLTTILTSQLPASDALKITAMIVVGVIVVAYISGRTVIKALGRCDPCDGSTVRPSDGSTVRPSNDPTFLGPTGALGGGAFALLLCACLALASGCASPIDGVRRGPFTGAQVNKAYTLAQQAGFQRVASAGNLGSAWIDRRALAAQGLSVAQMSGLPPQEFLASQLKLRELASDVGLSDTQIVRQYNARGLWWGVAGDTLLASIVAGGLTYGVKAISASDGTDGKDGTNGKDGEPAKPTVAGGTAPTVVVTSGDGSPVSINISQGEGNVVGGGSGGAAPAVEAVAP